MTAIDFQSTLDPKFNPTPTNVTFMRGDMAVLSCSVQNLGTKFVSIKTYFLVTGQGYPLFYLYNLYSLYETQTNLNTEAKIFVQNETLVSPGKRLNPRVEISLSSKHMGF